MSWRLSLVVLFFIGWLSLGLQLQPPSTGDMCDDGVLVSSGDMLSKGVCWGFPVLNPPPSSRNDAAKWTTHPLHGFHITCREITVAAYTECLLGGACDPKDTYPSSFDHRCTYDTTLSSLRDLISSDHFKRLSYRTQHDLSKIYDELLLSASRYPTNCVNFKGASDLCAWLGGRICTETEWNLASVGVYPDDRDPYERGKEFVDGVCKQGELLAFGDNLECNGGLHYLYDMGGSLAEWITAESGVPAVKWVHYDNIQYSNLGARDMSVMIVDQHVPHNLYGVRCCADPTSPNYGIHLAEVIIE